MPAETTVEPDAAIAAVSGAVKAVTEGIIAAASEVTETAENALPVNQDPRRAAGELSSVTPTKKKTENESIFKAGGRKNFLPPASAFIRFLIFNRYAIFSCGYMVRVTIFLSFSS